MEPDGRLNVAFDSLINPRQRIEYAATQVHGIYERDIQDAPTFREAAFRFFEALSGCVIASYNISFDMAFLRREMELLGLSHELPHFCIMWLRSAIQGGGRLKLGVACQNEGIALKNSHRSLDDTYATAELLACLLDSQWNVTTFRELAAIKKTYKFWSSFKHDLVPWEIADKMPMGGKLKSRSRMQPRPQTSATPKPAAKSSHSNILGAARLGTVADIEFFLKKGTNINIADSNGNTPLHYAARYNSDIRVLKYLLYRGASINTKSDKGRTPLDVASTDEKKRILREAGGKTGSEMSRS